jgi:hypothetical protein
MLLLRYHIERETSKCNPNPFVRVVHARAFDT